jgi:hypothetical protein
MAVNTLKYQCNPQPDVTRSPIRGRITKLLMHRHVCTHCGRVYYADDMAATGIDRPCPILLRVALQETEERLRFLEQSWPAAVGIPTFE